MTALYRGYTHVKSYVPLKVYSSLTQLICQLFRISFMRLHIEAHWLIQPHAFTNWWNSIA